MNTSLRFFSGEEGSGVAASSPFEEALPSAKVRSFPSCSSLFTKKKSTIRINGLPPTQKSRQTLKESARTNVTFLSARSTLQRLCLASFVLPSRTWIPSGHTPAVRWGNTSCGSPTPLSSSLTHSFSSIWRGHCGESGRCPSSVTLSWASSLSFASVGTGRQKEHQKPLVLMYNDRLSLLSTYFVPGTMINTWHVLAYYKHPNRPFCKGGKEGQNGHPRSPAIRWKNTKLNPVLITPKPRF